ncbi:MAG: NCS2 family permease [Spirochaetes bacterium]|nr:MAG: NCS2 family permease [Spirochaetota bacterium]
MTQGGFRVPFFARGDIDGFIGLFIDNLVNLILITGLCLSIGMPADVVFGKIMPGAALSVLAGNLFYSWQARRLAMREQRLDVTALPYGINTVSLFAFFSFIIAPIYIHTKDADLAWKVGVASCFISGFFEGVGAFVGERIRRITPRAALLSTLAGIALVFIALANTIPLWEKPLIAFVPMAFILMEYFSRVKLPFRIPAGLYALATGGVIAWGMGAMSPEALVESTKNVSFYVPVFALPQIIDGFADVAPYLGISVPMGVIAFFATIQNLESAAAAGDDYPAMPALAMNGIGTMVGSIFGSPFPTTVYIGHPGWKAMGARGGYSVLNGAVMSLICFTGLMSVIVALIPLEAGYPILLWIGIVITAQAFQTTPAAHAPAVALGLLPAIAAWGLSLLRQYINADGRYSLEEVNALIAKTAPQLKGITTFAEGPLLSAMFLTAVGVYLVERDFLRASLWALPLAVCAFFGVIHAPAVGVNMAPGLTVGYGLFAGVMLLVFLHQKKNNILC